MDSTEIGTSLTRRQLLVAVGGTAASAAFAAEPMPQVQIGRHRISRLIVGGNPVSGNSHVSSTLSREMTDYFSAANVKKLLSECEGAGINTWQSRGDRHIMRLLNEYRLEGGRIQWIAQTASELADIPRNITEIAARNAIGIYHHGTQTDRFWAAGAIGKAREMLKAMRQAGVLVGLGTHIPEVVDHVESEAWDLDFYMTCLYNLSRSKEEASRLAGRPVEDELFWEPDREKMLDRVRQVRKPCLIFKLYGASRRCASPEEMLGALRQAAQYAKPSDCFVIGMFPKYREQVHENSRLVREALAAS
jgi:hypothetical protein